MKSIPLNSEDKSLINHYIEHPSSVDFAKPKDALCGIILEEEWFTACLQELVDNKIKVFELKWHQAKKNYLLQTGLEDYSKAKRIVASHRNAKGKTLNIAIWGAGNVGSALIDLILSNPKEWLSNHGVHFNIFAVTNSSRILLDKTGLEADWSKHLSQGLEHISSKNLLIAYSKHYELENLVFIDTTANATVASYYSELALAGFDIVAANKIANTNTQKSYDDFRKIIQREKKSFKYETNVGAALPVIQTLKQIIASGDKVTRIRGTFSGSVNHILSSIRNGTADFGAAVRDARTKGFTEPDPREDLSGKDVARKLLVLARTIGYKLDLDDIRIKALIGEDLSTLDLESFLVEVDVLDDKFKNLFLEVQDGYHYVFAADIRLGENGIEGLEVGLQKIHGDSVLAQLSGTDTGFEVYTKAYGAKPICISGAGAGIELTARGILSDIFTLD
ncbi:MAG: hypothetical protein P8P48_14070 [Saprospiraceae bacterium]|nr:hypothetical protein [Saprospiraceae bacterium]